RKTCLSEKRHAVFTAQAIGLALDTQRFADLRRGEEFECPVALSPVTAGSGRPIELGALRFELRQERTPTVERIERDLRRIAGPEEKPSFRRDFAKRIALRRYAPELRPQRVVCRTQEPAERAGPFVGGGVQALPPRQHDVPRHSRDCRPKMSFVSEVIDDAP